MSEYVNSSYEELVPASVAARQVGYTCDYITRLARAGTITAQKIGRQWYVDANAVLEFARNARKSSVERKFELRASRKMEYTAKQRDVAAEINTAIRTGRMFALAQASLIAVFVLAATTVSYFSATDSQLARVIRIEIDVTPIEELARSFYYFISPSAKYADVQFSTPKEVGQQTQSYGVTVLDTEAKLQAVEDAFSDEVDASFDVEVSDSGVITPQFKDGPGTDVRFRLFLEEQEPRAQGG